MSNASIPSAIRLKGVRQNNLKGFDLDLPLGKLVVITGLSGSGKSSLAFDTLYAEGQRRYIETFSPYARQFFDRMDKPRVDSVEGIPPAIALEQRNSVKTTRSTIGTMTEITDYMKALWPHLSRLHCRGCGNRVRKDPPREIFEDAVRRFSDSEVFVTFQVELSDKLSVGESLELMGKQGFQSVIAGDKGQQELLRLDETTPEKVGKATSLIVIQDRLKVAPSNRARFVEACEQAYHFGKGGLCIRSVDLRKACHYSNRLHCAECDIEYRDPSPALFSFNNPVGACPACKGFGRVIAIDYQLAIPDRSLSLAEGAIKPWQTGHGLESQNDLLKFCRKHKIPADQPFQELSKANQDWVIQGDPDYGKDSAHEWPRAWYGVKGYFRWLESKAYKMHVRVLLSKYRCYITCPDCNGKRFKSEALLYRSSEASGKRTLADFYQLSVRDALEFIALIEPAKQGALDAIEVALDEVRNRLSYLEEVGLGYLALDRPTRSLSGGETERVNLTTCLGSRLVNTLFVLDEPSVGLHARDTDRLVKILKKLRDSGNTIVTVEHEGSIMRAADQIVDIGPGQGETGGQVVFQGAFKELLKGDTLTGKWLSRRNQMPPNPRREVNLSSGAKLQVREGALHNLKDFSADIPLNRFVCVTGVSGSGKSTLVRDLIYPALSARLTQGDLTCGENDEEGSSAGAETSGEHGFARCKISGWEDLGKVVMVDQSALGRTPRSNPAVYIGAFEFLRELFCRTEKARQRGLNASAFSFNSAQGQCERCRGAGFEKIEMQFLSDVFIRCPECQGRRYREHILEIKVAGAIDGVKTEWSIADMLEAPVDSVLKFLESFPESLHARKAIKSLALLQEVGLGYLRLGQPINTLSGGESQRLKLVSHLAEYAHARTQSAKPALFIFDEPTTGLHFQDVAVLLKALQKLVDAGHSLIVVEHHLEMIRSADWVIDLGPEAGEAGGQLVAQGRPEDIMASERSITGQCLRKEGERTARK
jgi:excinuclease ABC subunit A